MEGIVQMYHGEPMCLAIIYITSKNRSNRMHVGIECFMGSNFYAVTTKTSLCICRAHMILQRTATYGPRTPASYFTQHCGANLPRQAAYRIRESMPLSRTSCQFRKLSHSCLQATTCPRSDTVNDFVISK